MRRTVIQADLLSGLTRQQSNIVVLSNSIAQDPPDWTLFQHSVLCHVQLPRTRTHERRYEKSSGQSSLLIEAGALWTGSEWVQQPLPYGIKPRIAFMHIISEAIRTQSPRVDVGRSARSFMKDLGLDLNGRSYAEFRRQIAALSACRMTIGFGNTTIEAKPVEEFNTWDGLNSQNETSVQLDPGVIQLSSKFFATLMDHAVPLDPRAISGLQHSSLALDIYTWLAQRICRVDTKRGDDIPWARLKEQFGQDYKNRHSFKRDFLKSLLAVQAVYPAAHLEAGRSCLTLFPSSPPIAKTMVSMTGSLGRILKQLPALGN